MRRVWNMIQSIANWSDYLWYKWSGKKGNDFTFKLRGGPGINVPGELVFIFKECFFDQTYLKNFPQDLPTDREISIVDIGANAGYFSIYALHEYPKATVYSFEPMPANFDQLQQYQNALYSNRWNIFREAVGGNKGMLTLRYNNATTFTTSASLFENQYGSDEQEVPVTTLLNVMQQENLQKIDLLKLDCEGAEYDIIYQTPKEAFDNIQRISMETHPGPGDNENTAAMNTYLKNLGYQTSVLRVKIWAWK